MYFNKSVLFILFSLFVIAACSSDENAPVVEEEVEEIIPKSFEVNYTRVSPLGSNVNDDIAKDSGPEVSSNGLELYFHSDRDGAPDIMDLYVSTRATQADDWGPANTLGATINSAEDDRSPAISLDGLTLIFASDRAEPGNLDLYMSTRPTIDDPWTTPVDMGSGINTAAKETSPDISADGLSLFLLSDDAASGYGANDLYVSRRATILDPWPMPVNMGETINGVDYEAAPEIASDGLTLYFHKSLPDVIVTRNIYRSTRASIEDEWGAPEALPVPVNSSLTDVEPGLSNDWQKLYFANDVNNSRDIWVAAP